MTEVKPKGHQRIKGHRELKNLNKPKILHRDTKKTGTVDKQEYYTSLTHKRVRPLTFFSIQIQNMFATVIEQI